MVSRVRGVCGDLLCTLPAIEENNQLEDEPYINEEPMMTNREKVKCEEVINKLAKVISEKSGDKSEGYIDNSYLNKLEKYMVKHKYEAQKETDLSVDQGTIVYVEKKNPSGWWVCIVNNEKGLLPSNYLTEYKK